MKYADLADAKLMQANLTGADLHNAFLQNADLTNADLTNARLEGASLTVVSALNANFSSSRICQEGDVGKSYVTNFSGADIENAKFNNIGCFSVSQIRGALNWGKQYSIPKYMKK